MNAIADYRCLFLFNPRIKMSEEWAIGCIVFVSVELQLIIIKDNHVGYINIAKNNNIDNKI